MIVKTNLIVAVSEEDLKTVDFVEVDPEDLVLPDTICIKTDSFTYSTVVFVKAKTFFNTENTTYPKGLYEELRMDLAASDIQALMFSDDVVVGIDGKDQVCKAMQWINVDL
ncbi:MAG: hypothetical protein KKD44_04275 [Proteobacteria bacterium]|nr:hypothetical protein [Pseudomonadota bacterium]